MPPQKLAGFLQFANLGLILFATGPPGPSRTGVGKIQLGYPERLSCSTSDFEPLTFVIDLEHEFVIRAWVPPPCRAVALCEGGCSLPSASPVVNPHKPHTRSALHETRRPPKSRGTMVAHIPLLLLLVLMLIIDLMRNPSKSMSLTV